jgi:hypothetical protein
MSYEIIVRPEAAREVQEAFDWYEEKGEGLGFVQQMHAWPASKEIRSLLLRSTKTPAGHC